MTTDPAGARVSVNGNFVGITNFFPVEVHTGLARIEITLEGYQGYVDDNLRIEPGEINTIDLVLTRTSARLPIITDPPGVEVVVDGEVVGVTSGTLPPDLRSFMPPDLDPSRLSAPFELMSLPLGQHDIELRLECYESVRFPFRADEPRDYTAQIVKLNDSVGRVSVTSNPSDARVFLDGELKGNTPLELPRVCSGDHRLEVKHPTGKYVEDITVGPDESLSFECPIRPTLAVLDLIADEGVPGRDVEDIRQKLNSELRKLAVMNVVFPENDAVTRIVGGGGARNLVPALAPSTATPENIREATEKLGKSLEVEAVLLGYVPAQRLTKDVVLHFLAVGSPAPDRYALNYLDRDALPAFVEKLSTPTRLHGPWIGLTAIDTRITEGPIVLAVDPGGPAAKAGVQMGDIVQSVAGAAVSKAVDILRAVRGLEPGASLALTLGRGGKFRNGIRHGGNDASRDSFERGRVSLQQGHRRSPAPHGGGARSRRARRAERRSLLYAARRLRDGAQGISPQGDPCRDDGDLTGNGALLHGPRLPSSRRASGSGQDFSAGARVRRGDHPIERRTPRRAARAAPASRSRQVTGKNRGRTQRRQEERKVAIGFPLRPFPTLRLCVEKASSSHSQFVVLSPPSEKSLHVSPPPEGA